jgi:ribose transport system substrate-binding protein
MPPAVASAVEQQAILEQAISSRPDGIAVDPVDAVGHMQPISHLRAQGIPVVLFDSPSPDPGITSNGNDFSMQGQITAERLVTLIGGAGSSSGQRRLAARGPMS